jgi:DNA-binding GntR family transcriptional regulator
MAQQKADNISSILQPRSARAALPVQPFQTKADVARQHIMEMVVSGTVRAGDRLTTREVAEAVGMSDTPIREAMRILAAEGWLEFHPHMGVVVASVRREQLQEVYGVRGALEGLAIELGGPHYTAEMLDALDDTLQAAEKAVDTHDIPQYVHLNRQFHHLLTDTPATQWTLKVLGTLWTQTAAMHRGFEAVPSMRIRESLDEHWAIRNAIRAGDYLKAAALVVEHERTAGASLIASLSVPRADGEAGA